jgi:hypothetical protein
MPRVGHDATRVGTCTAENALLWLRARFAQGRVFEVSMSLRSLRRTAAAIAELSRVAWQVGAGVVDATRILFGSGPRKLPTLSSRELEGCGLPGF